MWECNVDVFELKSLLSKRSTKENVKKISEEFENLLSLRIASALSISVCHQEVDSYGVFMN